ncbi:MAG: SUMF1/EgtB/PvdO family nonheme iron enzyme [Mariprofundus sp.]|nr:SUMF1/EgtB/PvdO family nonheme iron enzyme [Mariprofundus sp.]
MLISPSYARANTWINIPSGNFLMGSTPAQVEQGYRISAKGYGHNGVRKAGWFDNETPQHQVYLPTYSIQKTAVTNIEYAKFIRATGYPAPFVTAKVWSNYRLVHPYSWVKPYLWLDGHIPKNRGNNPVVLLSYDDALAYAKWLSKKLGQQLQLPNEMQWEKAMRGNDGRLYPWGNTYDAERLNNADHGSLETLAVGFFNKGASPYGVLDGAGQVFEWTSTVWNDQRMTVKGGSWDDHGGVCRPAAHHGRAKNLKHILIGFRLVSMPD